MGMFLISCEKVIFIEKQELVDRFQGDYVFIGGSSEEPIDDFDKYRDLYRGPLNFFRYNGIKLTLQDYQKHFLEPYKMAVFWPVPHIMPSNNSEPEFDIRHIAMEFSFRFDKKLKKLLLEKPKYVSEEIADLFTPEYVKIIKDDVLMMKFSTRAYKDGQWVKNNITAYFKKTQIPTGRAL